MTLRFNGAELQPIIAEAVANNTELLLVKDQGVYMLSRSRVQDVDGNIRVAYAVGCNPAVDAFDDWWHLARDEMGGDDFGEYLEPDGSVFAHIAESGWDLLVSATATELCFEAVAPN